MENNSKKKGYTIIETMIAVSLFLLVVITGMGALLNANRVHNKSQDMREILDNLSFVMEDMSRGLRTGFDYHCFSADETQGGDLVTINIEQPQNCQSGNGAIAFEQQGTDPADDDESNQVAYKIYRPDGTNEPYNIFKSTNGGQDWTQLNAPEIEIEASSKFTVSGAEPMSQNANDRAQPFVTINLVGNIRYKNVVTPFSLQTSVSQRALDFQ